MNIQTLVHRVHALTAIAVLGLTRMAAATTPESGWWWNATESGRGFAIEIQNDTLFMAGFLYDASGAPFWFTSAGRFNPVSDTFESDMTSFRDGQCFQCPYRRPVLQPLIGKIRLQFSSPSEGTLTWPFGTLPITRQIYGLPSGIEQLFGTHAFSTHGTTTRVNFGNWVTFNRTQQDPNLGKVALGTTEAGRNVVAGFSTDQRAILVVVDASTSFFEAYLFPRSFFGTRGGTGLWTTYFKSSTPTIPSALAVSSRILSSGEIGLVSSGAEKMQAPTVEGSEQAWHQAVRALARVPQAGQHLGNATHATDLGDPAHHTEHLMRLAQILAPQ